MTTASSQDTLTATALLETGDAEATVKHYNHVGMQVEVDRVVRLAGTLKLAFEHTGAQPGHVRLLAAVDRARTQEDTMVLDLRYLALHSAQGQPTLIAFMGSVLGVRQIDPAAFKEGAGGWFYGFRATRQEGRQAPKERSAVRRKTGTEVVQSERREARVVVRVPLVFRALGKAYRGHAYNISYSGLYVLAEGALPPEGTPVQVAYPIALHAKPFKALLEGDIVWAMPSMTSSASGGLGIKLTRVDDGASGDVWREYVDKEAQFGGVVENG